MTSIFTSEMRLVEAVDKKLLCPFQYFGVSDDVDYTKLTWLGKYDVTESATVFLQQLARGLRLYDGKECLTVLDFIGQANKSYNFETKFRALVGKSRKSIQHYIENGFSNLPCGSYIQLEKLAQSYVLRNLKQTFNR